MLYVFKASAGSGKTYNLTFFYLKICFQHLEDPGYFQHILAMTFTNDATAEMKTRIIQELKLLASGDKNAEHQDSLMEACSLSKEQIQKGAKSILRYMMQHYTRFSISTIDSFFQRVLKIFMRELKLDGGYEVELDTDLVLDNAMEAFYRDLNEDSQELKWIEMILQQRMEEGKNYDFQRELLKLGKILFHEDIDLKMPERGSLDLREIYQKTLSRMYAIENSVRNNIEEVRSVLQRYDLNPFDFMKGQYGFMNNWLNNVGELRSAEENQINRMINFEEPVENWYAKSAPNDIKSKIEAAYPELQRLLEELKDLLSSQLREYYSLIEVRKNFASFAFLSTLDDKIQTYCRNEQKILLSRTSLLLKKVIDRQIMPFFYERLGQRYHHILLDEFQDTSKVQWENLKVLVDHALSEEGQDSLIVGDVKQAIYRWRNGDWRTLQVDLDAQYGPKQMIDSSTLKYNFRSLNEVIEFNNDLFGILPEIGGQYARRHFVDGYTGNYGLEMIQKVFEKQSQKVHTNFKKKRQGGYIQMDAITIIKGRWLNEEQTEKRWELLQQQIIDIIDRGYQMSDICILVRKAKEGTEVAQKLFEWRNLHEQGKQYFQCSSKDVLQLSSSLAVQAVIAFFKLVKDDSDPIAIAEWHQAITQLNGKDPTYRNFGILPDKLKSLLAESETQSIWEISDHIIEEAELGRFEGEIPFLQHLQDEILSYMQKEGGHVGGFLEWWEEKGYQSSVIIPEGQNAIRILTIHKSKGLEFPIVIMPYTNWGVTELTSLGQIPVWVWANEVNILGEEFSSFPLNFSGKLKNTDFREAYNDELLQQVIDNLNLLYVATTRAKRELYLHLPGVTSLEKDNGSVGDLIFSGAEQNFSFELMNEELQYYAYQRGNKTSPEKLAKETDNLASLSRYRAAKAIPPLSGRFMKKDIEGVEVNALSRGRALHWLFEQIESEKDIELALTQAFEEGRIDKKDRIILRSQIEGLFEDDKIGPLLRDSKGILHEREILLDDGKLLRPDRVILGDQETKVIDFKTGVHYPKNESQLLSYLSTLKRMNYPKVKGYLLYLDSGEIKEYS